MDDRAFGEWSMALVTPHSQLQRVTELTIPAELLDAPTHSPAALIGLMRQMIAVNSLVPEPPIWSGAHAAIGNDRH